MLQHMIKAQIINRIIRSMDMFIGIRELGFDHEGGGVAGLAGGGVVGACVAAFR